MHQIVPRRAGRPSVDGDSNLDNSGAYRWLSLCRTTPALTHVGTQVMPATQRRAPKGENQMATEAPCPFKHTAGGARSNRDWWPSQLNLKLLREFDPQVEDTLFIPQLQGG